MREGDDEGVKPELDRLCHAVKKWHFPLADRSKFASWELCDPARPEVLEKAECALGFALPPLLRVIYTRIGNGGMLLGLMGLPGGMLGSGSFEGHDIVAAYRRLVGLPQTRGQNGWPRFRVPISTPDDTRVIVCVDCSTPLGEVWMEGASGWGLTHSALVQYIEEAISGHSPI